MPCEFPSELVILSPTDLVMCIACPHVDRQYTSVYVIKKNMHALPTTRAVNLRHSCVGNGFAWDVDWIVSFKLGDWTFAMRGTPHRLVASGLYVVRGYDSVIDKHVSVLFEMTDPYGMAVLMPRFACFSNNAEMDALSRVERKIYVEAEPEDVVDYMPDVVTSLETELARMSQEMTRKYTNYNKAIALIETILDELKEARIKTISGRDDERSD
jgi:hypothetical protein